VVPSRIDFAVFDPALVTPQRVSAVRSTWEIGADTRAIVVAGPILRRKGHHVAVRAAGQLKEMGLRNFSFVFIGEDPGRSSYAGELWDLVLATQTSDVIRIVGARTICRPRIAPRLRSFALRSNWKARNAAYARRWQWSEIASDLAVGPETAPAPPGAAEDRMMVTFKSGDDRELTAALIRSLSAPESVRAAVGRRGRELAVAQFAGEQSAAQMLALYGELARLRA
jgi:glycosyltransferase involved in cell wall biosynthesis